MRTKTLLFIAALSAAGVATSMAQVFSVNAVGYVNKTIKPGKLALLSNPLIAADNSIAALFKGAPAGTQVYKYNGADFDIATMDEVDLVFTPPANAKLTVNPGEGVFVRNTSTADYQITFVGEVSQGNLSIDLPQGLSIRSSQVPQAGAVDALGLVGKPNDQLYKFDSDTANYSNFSFDEIDLKWTPSVPTIDVGEAVFLRKVAADKWTRTFSVN